MIAFPTNNHQKTLPDATVTTVKEFNQGTAIQTSYTYDSGGLVTAAHGQKGARSYAYLNRLDYDKFEQRVFQTLGNGVKTNYAYRPDNRRLSTLQATLPQGSQYRFQNLAYSRLET